LQELSGKTASQISWIGGLQAFLLVFVSVLSGPLYDAGYLNTLNRLGNLLVVFGLMMTSLCTEYWQVMLAQGAVTGVGTGLLFVPATALLPQYFAKRRNLAATIAAAGSGFGEDRIRLCGSEFLKLTRLPGGLIYPIIFREVQRSMGFGWAVRIVAFVALVLGLASVLTARTRAPARPMRELLDPAVFRDVPVLFFAVACFAAFAGLYIPAYYIGIHELSLGGSEDMAFYLVAIMQAGSLLGRIGPGYFADRTGPLNMFIAACFSAGILVFCWIAIENTAGMVVFAALYGTAFGLAMAMAAMCVLSLIKGQMARFGTTLGMCLLLSSPGILIGAPIAGAALKRSNDFTDVQSFSGSMIMFAGLCACAARIWSVGFAVRKI